MHVILTVCIATTAAHLVGTAVLFGIISGPHAILASPLLSMFGWFFVPLEMLLFATQWTLLADGRLKCLFTAWLVTVPCSAVLMAIIGPKVEGEYFRWSLAYAIATIVAASLGLVIVAASKSICTATTDAPIHGEPSDARETSTSSVLKSNSTPRSP